MGRPLDCDYGRYSGRRKHPTRIDRPQLGIGDCQPAGRRCGGDLCLCLSARDRRVQWPDLSAPGARRDRLHRHRLRRSDCGARCRRRFDRHRSTPPGNSGPDRGVATADCGVRHAGGHFSVGLAGTHAHLPLRLRPAARHRFAVSVAADVSFWRPKVRSRRTRGLWRSLVAHYTGGVGVAGSNPVSPTRFVMTHIVARSGRDSNFSLIPVAAVGRSALSGPPRTSYNCSNRYNPIRPTTTMTARSAFGDSRRP